MSIEWIHSYSFYYDTREFRDEDDHDDGDEDGNENGSRNGNRSY